MPTLTSATLSPSKISRFTQCPLAFKYAYVDHLPEPSTIHQVRGTLAHAALERLFKDCEGTERTRDNAEGALEHAWSDRHNQPEFVELGLGEDQEAQLLEELRSLIDRYFELEDPTSVRPLGLELHLRAQVDSVELNGIIDRLDDVGDGDFCVVDYKTGSSPPGFRTKQSFNGVNFYALLCEENYGRAPVEVRLMYLKDRVVLVQSVSEQLVRGARHRALAVWSAIERACASQVFRPNPSPLCRFCAFQSICPVFQPASGTVGP
ncbi:MAG: PD-(D/E)XK nuclease family protein [Acidimicrobiales bacterium]